MKSTTEYLKTRISIRKLDWGQALKKGEQLLKAGRAAESIPYFKRSLKTNPGEYGAANAYTAARDGLAEALRMTGQPRKSAALKSEMTSTQYWWGVIRGGLLVIGFIAGGGAAILFGSMFLLQTFAGREVPPVSLVISRGETTTIDLRFETPVDIAARSAIVEPAARYEGWLPWVIHSWKGFEHRDAANRLGGSAHSHAKEVLLKGQKRGLVYKIGAPDIVNGYGGSSVTISAENDIPTGLYKIWLAGAYLDHTRNIKRFHPDILVWQAGPPEKETVPRDAGIGVPVIKVTVK